MEVDIFQIIGFLVVLFFMMLPAIRRSMDKSKRSQREQERRDSLREIFEDFDEEEDDLPPPPPKKKMVKKAPQRNVAKKLELHSNLDRSEDLVEVTSSSKDCRKPFIKDSDDLQRMIVMHEVLSEPLCRRGRRS